MVPWTRGLALRCPSCGMTVPPGLLWAGCSNCGHPFETVYDDDESMRLPIAPELLTDLGLQPTPLQQLNTYTWLKLESRNPTGAHKDRFHAVTTAIARLSGACGIVTTSTGNHGVSCAAHAAADGLPCIVLATAALPRALKQQLLASAAVVGLLEEAERRDTLLHLVAEGWHPATASDPALSGAGNPYGVDGYRAVASEIVQSLGRMPDAVAIPVAGGDTLIGVMNGFLDLAAVGKGDVPTILACQPERAATLAASAVECRQVVLANPQSIARSTSDPMSGRLAIAAADRVVITEASELRIIETTRRLAHCGHYVETSSALALAGVEIARERGLIPTDAVAVALLTASGRGWNEDVASLTAGLTARSRAAVLAAATEQRAARRSDRDRDPVAQHGGR